MAQHNDYGYWGEDAAAQYLMDKGYTICQRDWKSGHRDIDIVAYDGEELVFVEVKSRRNKVFCNPEDAVDDEKINNLVIAAENYVNTYNIDSPTRFDIITVLGTYESGFEINHIKDAFLP